MARHNVLKRTLAGVLAVLTVAAYLPANVGTGGLFDAVELTASAEDETTTTVTWDYNTWSRMSSGTKTGGITMTAGHKSVGNVYSDGTTTFTAPNGCKFTNIEFATTYTGLSSNSANTGTFSIVDYSFYSTQDIKNVDGKKVTWTGDSSTVSFKAAVYAIEYIKFTYVGTPTKDDATYSVNANTLTYNGGAQTLVSTAGTGGTIYYRLGTEGDFSTTAPTAINAGDYTVQWYSLENDDYAASGSAEQPKSVNVTINKADPSVSDFTVTLPENLYYDGTSKPATIAVKDGIEGMGDLSVRYGKSTGGTVDNPVEVGTYYPEIRNKNGTNYQDSSVYDPNWAFTIEYAKAAVTLPEEGNVTIENVKPDENGVYTLEASGADYTITSDRTLTVSGDTNGVTLTKTGDYTYTLSLTPGTVQNGATIELTHNHATSAFSTDAAHTEPGKVWVQCSGEKADAAVIAEFKTEDTYYYGSAPSEEDIAITPQFGATAKVKANTFYFSAADDTTAKRLTAADLEIGKQYNINATVTVSLPGGTTSDYAISKEITYAARPMEKCEFYLGEQKLAVEDGVVTVPDTAFTYTGEEQKPEIKVVNPANNEVLATKDYTDAVKAQTDAGKYEFTLTAAENGNYADAVTVDWSIAKAQRTITAEAKADRIYDGAQLDASDFTFSEDGKAIEDITKIDADTNVALSFGTDGTISSLDMSKAVNYRDGVKLAILTNGQVYDFADVGELNNAIVDGSNASSYLYRSGEDGYASTYGDEGSFYIDEDGVIRTTLNGVERTFSLPVYPDTSLVWYAYFNEEYKRLQISYIPTSSIKSILERVGAAGTDGTSAGDHTANFTITSKNYTYEVAPVDVTIKKRSVTLTPKQEKAYTYGDTTVPEISYTVEEQNDKTNTGFIAADAESAVDFFGKAVKVGTEKSTSNIQKDGTEDAFDYTAFVNDAGTYNYAVADTKPESNSGAVLEDQTPVMNLDALKNYDLTIAEGSEFTITKKALDAKMFTVTDPKYTYNGKVQNKPGYDFADAEFLDGTKTLTENDFKVGGTPQAILPGTYTVEFDADEAEQSNYTGWESYNWTIAPDEQYIAEVSAEGFTYNGKTVEANGNVAVKFGEWITEETPVLDDDNHPMYDEEKNPIVTTTTRFKPITAPAGAKTTYTYYAYDGESDLTPDYVKSLTALDGAPKDAGNYIVAAHTTARGYSFSDTYATFTIEQKLLTVTPNVTEKTYGDADPELTFTVEGAVEGETDVVTGPLTFPEGYKGDADKYTLVLSGLNSNYKVDPDDLRFDVKAQELTDENITKVMTCILDGKGWGYPSKSIEVTATVNGETVTLEAGKDYKVITGTQTKKTGEILVQIEGINNYSGLAAAYVNVVQYQEAVTDLALDITGIKTGNKVTFTVSRDVKNADVIESGFIYTKTGADLTGVTLGSDKIDGTNIKNSKSANTDAKNELSQTITDSGKGISVIGYVTYKDITGEIKTDYSDVLDTTYALASEKFIETGLALDITGIKTGNKVTFTVSRDVENAEVVESGFIYTKNCADLTGVELGSDKIDGTNIKNSKSSNTDAKNELSQTITDGGDGISVIGYVTYKTAAGNVKTEYTDVLTTSYAEASEKFIETNLSLDITGVKTGNKVTFTVSRDVVNAEVVESGFIYTKTGADLTGVELDSDKIDGTNIKNSKSSNTDAKNELSQTITDGGDGISVIGYVTYKTAAGAVKTEYTDVLTTTYAEAEASLK